MQRIGPTAIDEEDGSMLRAVPVPLTAARRLGLLAAVASLLVGCSTAGTPSAAPSAAPPAAASGGGGTSITAALSEFKIELGATSAPAGAVSFALTNKGTTLHEFVVFQTDLAVDKLPLTADGTIVDEAGAAGITLVDEVEDIEVGATPTLDVTLPAGKYLLICNIPAHYTSGMRAEFTAS
jgi:uncharacterized cupredoxin-like copper-binding protein